MCGDVTIAVKKALAAFLSSGYGDVTTACLQTCARFIAPRTEISIESPEECNVVAQAVQWQQRLFVTGSVQGYGVKG